MHGRSGQYSGVRGSGAVSLTAGVTRQEERGKEWVAGSVAPSWKEVLGGGSSQPGVFQDIAGSMELSGVCFLLLLFLIKS